jgi:hypothetical protein
MIRSRFGGVNLRTVLVVLALIFWALTINDGLHIVSLLVALIATAAAARAWTAPGRTS